MTTVKSKSSKFNIAKYDITKHPNYKHLADYDKKNTFDIEKFLSTTLKLKPDEEYDVYEFDINDEVVAEYS